MYNIPSTSQNLLYDSTYVQVLMNCACACLSRDYPMCNTVHVHEGFSLSGGSSDYKGLRTRGGFDLTDLHYVMNSLLI